MAEQSAMETPPSKFWGRLGALILGAATIISAIAAVYSYRVAQNANLLSLTQSAKMYQASAQAMQLQSGVETHDVILTAATDAVLPDSIFVLPRFSVPGIFSDDETLGDEIVLNVGNGRDIIVTTEGGNRVLTIVSIDDKVCRSGEKSRKLCQQNYSVSEYHVQLSFGGGDTKSRRLVVDPNF